MALLVAIVTLNSLCAATDGTGRESVAGEFPRRTVMGVIGEADGPGNMQTPYYRTVFDMEFGEDGTARTSYLGKAMENRVYVEWVRHGEAYYYTNTRELPQGDGTGDGEGYYAVRIIQPAAGWRGGLMRRWAWILHDVTEGTVWSYWFELGNGGSATVGAGSIDYETASADEIASHEAEGSWRTLRVPSGCGYAIEAGECSFQVRFLS